MSIYYTIVTIYINVLPLLYFMPFEDLFFTNCDCNRRINDYCDNDNSSNFHDITIVCECVHDWSGFCVAPLSVYYSTQPIEHIQYISLLAYNALANDNIMIGFIVQEFLYFNLSAKSCKKNVLAKICWIKIDILIDKHNNNDDWLILIDLNSMKLQAIFQLRTCFEYLNTWIYIRGNKIS